MSWELASTLPAVEYAFLIRIDLPGGVTLRVHHGVGILTWGGNPWLGAGSFGEVSAVSTGSGIDADTVDLTLSGIPSALRSELLNETARGSQGFIYEGFRNPSTGVWSVEPELIFSGFVDGAPIKDGEDDPEADQTISQTVRLLPASAWARRLSLARRTDGAHQSIFSGDDFFSSKADMRTPANGPAGPVSPRPTSGKFPRYTG